MVPCPRCQRDVGKEKRPGKYAQLGGQMHHWARHHRNAPCLFQSIEVSLGESPFLGPSICPSIQLKPYKCTPIQFLLLQNFSLSYLENP